MAERLAAQGHDVVHYRTVAGDRLVADHVADTRNAARMAAVVGSCTRR